MTRIRPSRRWLFILFAGLLTWSLLMAAGTALMADTFDVRKPLIVLGTMGSFLGIWLIALFGKSRREKANSG